MRIILIVSLIAVSWMSQGTAEDRHSPYAELERRDIAALSENDIAELEAGRGWGLALPAELNGYPGPTHVLELAEELDLTAGQQAQITGIFKEMQSDAVVAGTDLIVAETALDQAFADGEVTQAALRDLVEAAGTARSDLRLVHLSSHLMTIDILSNAQVEQYNVLRGYAEDPCATVPDGHDEAMWRQHNGCVD